jgi:hypothetical protein
MIFFEGMTKRDIKLISENELPYQENLDFFNEYKKLNRFEFIYVDVFNKTYYKNLTDKLI